MRTDNEKEVKFMKSEERIERFWRKHQWMMPVCFILSLAFTVGTIAICIVRGFSGMSAIAIKKINSKCRMP